MEVHMGKTPIEDHAHLRAERFVGALALWPEGSTETRDALVAALADDLRTDAEVAAALGPSIGHVERLRPFLRTVA